MFKREHDWDPAGKVGAPALPTAIADIAGSGERHASLVRFLAMADGWQAAGIRLSGAFADQELSTRPARGKE